MRGARMRLWLMLCGLLITVLIGIAVFGEHSSTPRRVSLMDELFCTFSGGCHWQNGVPVSESYASYAVANLRPGNPGFLVPPRAEPEPTPSRQNRLNTLLSCSNDELSASSEYRWPTQNSLYWDEDAPPPPMMIERAEAGDAEVMFDLAYGYLSGQSDLEDNEADALGFEWLLRAAEHGHTLAQNELGAAYSYGYFGQNIDYPTARQYLLAASESGDPLAMLSLALLPPEQGQDLSQYAEARLELELRSAELCHAEALAHIVDRLRYGRGLTADPVLAQRIAQRVTGIATVGEPGRPDSHTKG